MELAVRTISHYSSDMDILLVGEGDFSFSAALATAFQRAPRLLATSLDSREMLHIKYGWLIMEQRLMALSMKGVVVMNEVDVRRIAQHPSLRNRSFDRIVYNFPHSGFVPGLHECTKALIRKHRELMRAFFKNVRRILKVDGEVHVAQHMCDPYSRWRLEEEAAKSGLRLRAHRKFEAEVFQGYTPRRGAGDNANGGFPLRNPVTFIFFLPSSSPPSSCISIPSPPHTMSPSHHHHPPPRTANPAPLRQPCAHSTTISHPTRATPRPCPPQPSRPSKITLLAPSLPQNHSRSLAALQPPPTPPCTTPSLSPQPRPSITIANSSCNTPHPPPKLSCPSKVIPTTPSLSQPHKPPPPTIRIPSSHEKYPLLLHADNEITSDSPSCISVFMWIISCCTSGT